MTASDGASGGSAEAPPKRPRTRRTTATKGSPAKAQAPTTTAAKKPAVKAGVAKPAPASKPSRAKAAPAKASVRKATAPKRTGATASPEGSAPDAESRSAARVASPAKPAVAPPSPAFELYFVRHADAGDPAEWSGDDADRPLSKKGRRQARRLAAALDDLRFRPDALLTSPKLRADDTAKALSRRLRVPVTVDQRLAGELDGQGLESLLADVDGAAGRVILVGHDPDFSHLVSWLVGGPVAMRKGALARVDLPGRAAAAGLGSLRWLLPPDALPG